MNSPFLSTLWAILLKDLTLLGLRAGAFIQALLLGLILIFVFSLSQGVGETLSAQNSACVFWLSSLFGQVLLFNQLYNLEEVNRSSLALLLRPSPPQSIYLAKTLAGLILLILAQLIFLPASIIFLGQNLPQSIIYLLVNIILIDLGLAALGSLLGALAQGQSARESLLSILLFPLLTPLLLAGISLQTHAYTLNQPLPMNWLSLALSFDAIFLSAGLLLFPYIYNGED
ncbi:MAG: heme exporter protein CcmB [Desulfovibrionaceae bacterium]|nr:heme exporter protein CcmB [Desulfovibrionaceae bacterium]